MADKSSKCRICVVRMRDLSTSVSYLFILHADKTCLVSSSVETTLMYSSINSVSVCSWHEGKVLVCLLFQATFAVRYDNRLCLETDCLLRVYVCVHMTTDSPSMCTTIIMYFYVSCHTRHSLSLSC